MGAKGAAWASEDNSAASLSEPVLQIVKFFVSHELIALREGPYSLREALLIISHRHQGASLPHELLGQQEEQGTEAAAEKATFLQTDQVGDEGTSCKLANSASFSGDSTPKWHPAQAARNRCSLSPRVNFCCLPSGPRLQNSPRFSSQLSIPGSSAAIGTVAKRRPSRAAHPFGTDRLRRRIPLEIASAWVEIRAPAGGNAKAADIDTGTGWGDEGIPRRYESIVRPSRLRAHYRYR